MKKKSFTGLLSGLLLGIILATFLLTTVVSNYYIRKHLVENAIENGQRSVSADGASLEIYLSYLRRSSMELYYNTSVYTILYQKTHDYMDSSSVFAFLQSLINLSEGGEISQIYMNLYRSGESYLVGAAGRIQGGGEAIFMPESLEKYQAYGEGPHLLHTYGTGLPEPEESLVYSFHWQIYNTMGDQVIGTLSFDVSVEKLAEYLVTSENGNPIYLLDSQGKILFSNTELLSEEQRQELLRQKQGWVEMEGDAFQGIAFVQKVESPVANWWILELNPREQLFYTSDQILKWELLFMVAAGLVCAGVVLFLILQMLRPLRDLERYVQAVEKGDLTVRIRDFTRYRRKDEIGLLVDHMESMMNTVNEMFVRQQNLSRAHRSVEMRMLLAQVNPHFIYNTLQSISTLALLHRDLEVHRLLVKLGAQMQYSINLERETAELWEEVRYTENYLDLQRQRFAERFTYEMQVEPGADKIVLPRMTLQPLAENAVKHGQIHRIPSGFIRIQVFRQGDMLQMVLEDNGKGCGEIKREELNRQLKRPAEEIHLSEHIGMQNVQYRLKLLYGEKVSMEIGASRWGGCRVCVAIPLDQYEGGPKHEGADCR